MLFLDPKMLRGRNILRRVKQRRVLSKNFRRLASITVADDRASQSVQIPVYMSLLAFIVFALHYGIKPACLLMSIHFSLKRYGFWSKIQTAFQAWRRRRQDHGPTSRQKLYYYVDYWLSTNPYVLNWVETVKVHQCSISQAHDSFQSVSN